MVELNLFKDLGCLKELITLLRRRRSESDCGHSFFCLGGRVDLTGAIIVAWTALEPQLHCAMKVFLVKN